MNIQTVIAQVKGYMLDAALFLIVALLFILALRAFGVALPIKTSISEYNLALMAGVRLLRK